MLKKQIQSTEYQYVKGVLENDPHVLKKIYQDHLSGIIAMVKKNNGSVEDAKDVFQEAILIVYWPAISVTHLCSLHRATWSPAGQRPFIVRTI